MPSPLRTHLAVRVAMTDTASLLVIPVLEGGHGSGLVAATSFSGTPFFTCAVSVRSRSGGLACGTRKGVTHIPHQLCHAGAVNSLMPNINVFRSDLIRNDTKSRSHSDSTVE